MTSFFQRYWPVKEKNDGKEIIGLELEKNQSPRTKITKFKS